MGEERLPDLPDGELQHRAAAGARSTRVGHRRVFREMVKGEIEDKPLRWHQRRALVRFGESLGLDSFEARLIIRAVEYECGHVSPAAMADTDTAVNEDYLARLGSREASSVLGAILLVGVLLGLVLLGLE